MCIYILLETQMKCSLEFEKYISIILPGHIFPTTQQKREKETKTYLNFLISKFL